MKRCRRKEQSLLSAANSINVYFSLPDVKSERLPREKGEKWQMNWMENHCWMDAAGWRTCCCATLITDNIRLLTSSVFSFLLSFANPGGKDVTRRLPHAYTLLLSPPSLSLSLSFGDIIVRTVMDVQPDNGKHVKKSTSQKLEDQKKVKRCYRLLSCRWRCGRTCLFVYLPIFIPLLHWRWRSWLNCSCTIHQDCTMGAGLSGVGGAGFLAGYFSID